MVDVHLFNFFPQMSLQQKRLGTNKLCVPKVIQEVNFPKSFLEVAQRMDCGCAPMLQFFSMASDGATTERQIWNRVFLFIFFPNLRKDSVAICEWILVQFTTSVRGLEVLYNALNVSQFRRQVAPQDLRQKFSKTQKNRPQICAKYFV